MSTSYFNHCVMTKKVNIYNGTLHIVSPHNYYLISGSMILN